MSERSNSSRNSGNQDGSRADGAPGHEDSQAGFDLFLAVSDCLRSWRSFDAGSARLLRELAGGLGQEAAALWLPDGDALEARAVWSASGIDSDALEERVLAYRPQRGTGVPGQAWMHAEIVAVDTVASDGMPEIEGLRGTLGIPALAGSRVVCVVELYATAPPALSVVMKQALDSLARELGAFFSRRRGQLEPSPLTARELEVLDLAALGLAVSGIGERLMISRGTVKSHLEHIYSKLGVANRTAAVAQALRTGLID
ncbi:MAG TPA: response regulator transcription factor [Solirubrobacteraceae bacterium]